MAGQALIPRCSGNGQHRRSVNLHGHSHGKSKPLPRQHAVGADARGIRSVSLNAPPGFSSA
ncbi:MAG: hypothetical protein DCF31_03985 [Alphaproteobacteria bacterium]|nr:MAG: hypothetical protein DCF31_03985 [Alphaproteobacteria bacterium]